MQKWTRIAALIALSFTGVAGITCAHETPPQFKDGQKVVFFGDSITHSGWYEYYVQLFYATRFPDRKIQFENAGVAGASAAGSLDRLNQDVFARKPDWVYIMFGMNDVGRNYYKTADAGEKTMNSRTNNLKSFENRMTENISRIKAAGILAVIVTPSPYDQYSLSIKTENLTACNDGLARCAEIDHKIADAQKCPLIDLHADLTAILKKNPELNLAADRVHPNNAGHMIMAYYILLAQKVPELVSKTVIDCTAVTVEKAENCAVENLDYKDGSVKFTYTSKALPFPVSDEYSKANKIVPWEALNQEIIQVKSLPAGDYRIISGGKESGRFSAAQFAAGVNIAILATPQQGKSAKIRNAVISKANADRSLRGLVQVNCILWSAKIDPADIPASDKFLDEWFAKVSEQYKKYYTGVIKSYRENRNRLPELLKKSDEAQENIIKLQKTESCLIEITREI